MLILLPPSLQKLQGERDDLQLVVPLLGGNADRLVDAIDGLRLNFTRHERFAQLRLLLLLHSLGLPLFLHLLHLGVGGD